MNDLNESIKQHGIGRDMVENIVIDMDGVLTDFYRCRERCIYSNYPMNINDLKRDQCPLVRHAWSALRALRRAGFGIILWTGRVEAERKVTEKWLAEHDFPYDKLIMDKPRAVMYIDDFGYHFKNWDDAVQEITK